MIFPGIPPVLTGVVKSGIDGSPAFFNGLRLPSGATAAWRKNADGTLTEYIGESSILFASGDASTWLTTAVWGFERTAATIAIDTALGGNKLFIGTTPIYRTWAGWMDRPWMNATYLFLGERGAVGYDSNQSAKATQIKRYLRSLVLPTISLAWASFLGATSEAGPNFACPLPAGVIPNFNGGTQASTNLPIDPTNGLAAWPAYTAKAINSVLAGAVSGSPGTPPTEWNTFGSGGQTVFSGNQCTITCNNERRYFTRGITGLIANSTYYYSFEIDCNLENPVVGDVILIGDLPAGASVTYSIDGVNQAGVNAPISHGVHIIGVRITVAATPGGATIRFGAGISGSLKTGTLVARNIMVTDGLYSLPYVDTTNSTATSIVSTAGGVTYGPKWATLPTGQIRTVSARFILGTDSTLIVTDNSLLSLSNGVAGLTFLANGGLLKATDGTSTATVTVADGWQRRQQIDVFVMASADLSTFKIGYRKLGESAITWGSDAVFDGEFGSGDTTIKFAVDTDKLQYIKTLLAYSSSKTDARLIEDIDNYA